MSKQRLLGVVASGLLLCPVAGEGASYASGVVDYRPGVGFATDFATGAGYTNAVSALGEPARITSGPFGGPVDPFSPPFLAEQLVSIGTGGALVLSFPDPIMNRVGHPFGIDFIVHGNSGFVIANGDFTGGGITDGSLFGANPGRTRVSVSPDNISWYVLDPAVAPVLDGMFPTDGSGSFGLPVDPALRPSDFVGSDLAAIRARYEGSAGGTGFDLSWALSEDGGHADLSVARFVKVEVLEGVAEIDAVVVVPEPSTWTIGLLAVGLIWRRRRNQR